MIDLPDDVLANGQDRDTWFRMFETFAANTAGGFLGIRLVDVAADHLVLELEITDRVRQPYGLLHGGVSLLLAEEAASSHALWGIDPTRVVPVGIEVSGSHLHSARNGVVRARAEVLRRTRSTIVHQVRITHVGSGELLSVVRVTNLYKPLRPGGQTP